MSPSAINRRAGFLASACINGEKVSYGQADGVGSTPLTAVVHRNVARVRDGLVASGQMDFSVFGMTEVEFLDDAIAAPEVGMFFVDSLGIRHRIRYVARTDITFVVYCSQSS